MKTNSKSSFNNDIGYYYNNEYTISIDNNIEDDDNILKFIKQIYTKFDEYHISKWISINIPKEKQSEFIKDIAIRYIYSLSELLSSNDITINNNKIIEETESWFKSEFNRLVNSDMNNNIIRKF